MTKHAGKYYLQYGGPGTEFSGYGDGVYVGDMPLGPFTYQAHNPFSLQARRLCPRRRARQHLSGSARKLVAHVDDRDWSKK